MGAILRLPINHFEGNYTCDAATLERLRAEDRVVLRYTDNPNGSVDDIAGICNEAGNVVGLMPHPERACDALTGATDGMVAAASRWSPWPTGRRRVTGLSPVRTPASAAQRLGRPRRLMPARSRTVGARRRRRARRCSRCPCARP